MCSVMLAHRVNVNDNRFKLLQVDLTGPLAILVMIECVTSAHALVMTQQAMEASLMSDGNAQLACFN